MHKEDIYPLCGACEIVHKLPSLDGFSMYCIDKSIVHESMLTTIVNLDLKTDVGPVNRNMYIALEIDHIIKVGIRIGVDS